MSKAFMVFAVLAALAGMGLGIQMGIKQDFTLAPAHAHNNLVGFVIMFLAGLFYDMRPQARGFLCVLHFVIAVAGAVTMVIGIAGVKLNQPWGESVAIPGSLLTITAMAIFALQVLRFGSPSRP